MTLLDTPAPHRTTRLHERASAPPCFRWDMRTALSRRELDALRSRFTATNPVHRSTDPLPDPGIWAANLACGIVEILYGIRPLAQVQRWVLPSLYDTLSSVRPVYQRFTSTAPCRPQSWRACHISADICEVSVVVSSRIRTRAVALRLENYRGRWIATALDIL